MIASVNELLSSSMGGFVIVIINSHLEQAQHSSHFDGALAYCVRTEGRR